MEVVEFNVVRSKSYKKAISNFEGVWKEDLQVMVDYLSPRTGHKILEIGAGSGWCLNWPMTLMETQKEIHYD